jgi:nucleoside 2-deoxyribosyltransferase
VLANLNPFRGDEPDSGTCVEIGYALALGKPVIGYAEDLRPLRERLGASRPGADGRCRDGAGNAVEDFGLPLNLMLAVPVQLVQGGIEAALAALERSTSAGSRWKGIRPSAGAIRTSGTMRVLLAVDDQP